MAFNCFYLLDGHKNNVRLKSQSSEVLWQRKSHPTFMKPGVTARGRKFAT